MKGAIEIAKAIIRNTDAANRIVFKNEMIIELAKALLDLNKEIEDGLVVYNSKDSKGKMKYYWRPEHQRAGGDNIKARLVRIEELK